MYFREAGQYKTTYQNDLAAFPLLEDRIGMFVWGFIAFVLIPFVGIPGIEQGFLINTLMIPFLIFTLATVGLNLLVGFAGQISLGTGAFMGVGAYSCYKLISIFPEMNIIIAVLLSGVFSAIVGVFFGLPSLRIKGFYLVVTTLAAQFFLEWAFIRVEWLYNYNDSGAIEVPQRELFGIILTGPSASNEARYFVVLIILILLTWVASNVIRGRVGRSWMMIRDMDIAAELIGVRPLTAKLTAFAFSSYYIGVAGALMVFFWLGAAEVESFDVNVSFQILFMVILGGLGSLTGCFMGAAVIYVLPILMRTVGQSTFGIDATTMQHVSEVLIGVLIIFFLIKEPHGLARLWQIGKQKLRIWPFPH